MANVLELYNRFKGGGKGGKMVYPLENQADYLGKITFHPIDETPVQLQNEFGNLVALGKELIEKSYDGVRSLLDPTTSTDPKVIADDEKVKSVKAKAIAAFNGTNNIETSKAFDENSVTGITGKKISLYLPRAIQIQDTVTYDNTFQLGLIGGTAEQALNSASSVAGAIGGVVAGQAKGIYSMLGGDNSGMSRDAAGIIAGRVTSKIGGGLGEGIGGAIRSATQLTTNPNTRALFRDVPIRNFSFAFQLVPTSRVEARMIETIIKTFREELYPEALQAGGINIGYRFPNRFIIKVKYNNRDIPGIKFLPVYMQSFNATYNAGTGGMHSDGKFTSVDISMAFTETRAIAKADVEKGGY